MADVVAETKTIYQVLQNADSNEGRGPMVPIGFFESEDEAWEFADQHQGTMGYFPPGGTWRGVPYGDVRVTPVQVVKKGAKKQFSFDVHIKTNLTPDTKAVVMRKIQQWINTLTTQAVGDTRYTVTLKD